MGKRGGKRDDAKVPPKLAHYISLLSVIVYICSECVTSMTM